MRPVAFAAFRSQAAPWTCRRCLQHGRGASFDAAGKTTRVNRRRHGGVDRKGAVLLAATGGAVGAMGAGALALTDDVKHRYTAVQRSGRVLTTLVLCINELIAILIVA